MDLAIRSVNTLLAGRPLPVGAYHALAPNLRFLPRGAITFSPDARTLIGGALDAEVAEDISTKRPPAGGLPTGLFEFRDVHLAPPFGAVFDFANRCCWQGNLMGWNPRDFRIWTERLPGCTVSEKTLTLASPQGVEAAVVDEAVLISAPHYDGYGHWLLDFLPRVAMADDLALAELPFYCDPGHGWARDMARALAPVRFLDGSALASGWVKVKRLVVPSVSRILHTADPAALIAAWARLGAALDGAPCTSGERGGGPRRIAMSRTTWSNSINRRRLLNASSVEAQLERRGFTIIHPQDLSLAEQRHLFHHADVIVGEDGSAIHNTIHCRAGTRIGVYAMGRTNTVHLTTAQMLGHRLTYIPTEPVLDHEASAFLDLRRLETSALEAALDRLCAAPEP